MSDPKPSERAVGVVAEAIAKARHGYTPSSELIVAALIAAGWPELSEDR